MPFAATLSEAVVLSGDARVIFSQKAEGRPVGSLAQEVLACLSQYAAGIQCGDVLLPSIYAIDARHAIGLLVTDAAYDVARSGQMFHYRDPNRTMATMPAHPLAFWCRSALAPAPWADPYKVLVHTDLRNDVGLDEFYKYLGVPPAILGAAAGSALGRAQLAWWVTQNAGLVIPG